MPFWFFIGLIFFLGGFIQGLTGFGSALVALPLLALLIDIKVAVPLCTLNGLIITAFLSMQLGRQMDVKKIMPLLVGCLPGIYFGVVVLKKAPDSLLKILLGAMLIAYALYRLAIKPRSMKIHHCWAYAAGFASGAISGAFSAGGPPTIIYTTLKGWSKNTIKATLSGFFFAGGLATAGAHAVSGLTTITVLNYFARSSAFVLTGVFLGALLFKKLDTTGYLTLIFVCLLLLGVVMIVSV